MITRRLRGVVAASAAALLTVVSTSCSVGLSGSSTCREYMQASTEAQHRVVSDLASKYEKGVWATPMGFPGVAYYCASHATTTLDEFFAAAESY